MGGGEADKKKEKKKNENASKQHNGEKDLRRSGVRTERSVTDKANALMNAGDGLVFPAPPRRPPGHVARREGQTAAARGEKLRRRRHRVITAAIYSAEILSHLIFAGLAFICQV